MTTIKRELQRAKWEYNFDTNELSLFLLNMDDKGAEPTKTVISKTYTYSLGRFLIRVWQKMASRSIKKRKIKTDGVNTSLANIKVG